MSMAMLWHNDAVDGDASIVQQDVGVQSMHAKHRLAVLVNTLHLEENH
jgi:hypothetical protein